MSLEELKKLERRFYLKCALGAAAGVILIAIGWKMKGIPGDILVIGGGFVVLISLLVFSKFSDIFLKARAVLKEAETGEEFKETYINWPPWLKKWGIYILVVIAFVGTGYCGKMHENDFGGLKFLWHSIIWGLIAGIILYNVLKLKFQGWTENKNKSAEIAFYIILAAVFVFVCFSPLINKSFAKTSISCKEFRLKPGANKNLKKAQYLTVLTEKGSERFNPPGSFIRKLSSVDSTVILCIRKGALGYEYVEEFRLSPITH